MKTHIAYLVTIMLCIITIAIACCRCSHYKNHAESDIETVTDTLIIERTDTIKVDSIVPQKPIFITKHDTTIITERDTIVVEIPISHYVYEDSISTIAYHGYESSIDSIEYRLPYKEVRIETIKKQKAPRLGLDACVGLQVGYGYGINGWTPYVGVGATIGVSYRLTR